MMNSSNFCQSCGMPLAANSELDMRGTNADGSLNDEYCSYCFKDGSFIEELTMEEMIDVCVSHMQTVDTGFTPEGARSMLEQFLPNLKRWKND